MNQPAALAKAGQALDGIQKEFNASQSGRKKVSLADLIVLGGNTAVEQAAKKDGYEVKVPFSPGRTDASQQQTDMESFAVLPQAGSLTTSARGTLYPLRKCWWIERSCSR